MDELERKQRNSYTHLERKNGLYTHIQADIKGTKIIRKGEMRHKNYKRVKQGGGGWQETDSERERTGKRRKK